MLCNRNSQYRVNYSGNLSFTKKRFGITFAFLRKFEDLLQTLSRRNKYLIIGGDFNIDFNCKNIFTQKFMDVVNCYNLIVTVREPTRVAGNSSKCIDNLLVSASLANACKLDVLLTFADLS